MTTPTEAPAVAPETSQGHIDPAARLRGGSVPGFSSHPSRRAGALPPAQTPWRRRFMSFQMSGVRISCIARSSLPPGTTMVLARDMKLSWIIRSR